MSNKEEWVKFVNTKARFHPLLVLLFVTLLIINVTFVALGVNQYATCSQGIKKIKNGLLFAKNTFEVTQANSLSLIDSTLFTMVNEYFRGSSIGATPSSCTRIASMIPSPTSLWESTRLSSTMPKT